ncbi:MAG: acpS [Frankiales bacterium]|nr:acpS [Frankiales bacterium]
MASRVGIDLASVSDVREAVAAHGDRYLRRVYTPQELVDCGGDPARLAGRFAAKEAAIKVLRPRRDTALPWSDIEVLRHSDGWTELRLGGSAALRAEHEGLAAFSVSLSHEGDTACAVVMAEGKGSTGR